MTLRYIPDEILALYQGSFRTLPVTGIEIHPPGHNDPGIRSDYTLVVIKSAGAPRKYGFNGRAYSNSELRAVVEYDGKDEVRAKWEVCKIP